MFPKPLRPDERSSGSLATLGLVSLLAGALPLAASTGPTSRGSRDAAARAAYLRLPLSFEPNRGQSDSSAPFLTRGAGYSVSLAPTEAVLRLRGSAPKGASAPRSQIRMRLVGASAKAQARTESPLRGKVSYFRGRDPRKWLRGLPTYGRVRFDEVYPRTDVVYYGRQTQLEYDFVLHPGANPSALRLQLDGASRVSLDEQGDLLLRTPGGVLRQHRPVVYQVRDGRREPVSGRYRLLAANQVGFEVARYDRTRDLVIDPVLSYSTFFGGFFTDFALGVAVDNTGGAVLTGQTDAGDFITKNPIQQFGSGNSDGFVSRFNASGSDLLYSTYFGGSGDDVGTGIALDSTGSAYVTGLTNSDLDFPIALENNPLQGTYGGGQRDAFIAKLSASGTQVLYGSFIGGSDTEGGTNPKVTVDGTNAAIVVGETRSSNFPTTAAAQNTFGGGVGDAFIVKVAPDGGSFVFRTYLGGSGSDIAFDVDTDNTNGILVAGTTSSANFPTANSLQAFGGGLDAFLTRIAPSGAGPATFSTFLGGNADDAALAIAVDAQGMAYLTGYTASTNFPTLTPIDGSLGGAIDAFVTKIDPANRARVYSTYLGGSNLEAGHGIAVDSTGAAYVVGRTTSPDLPLRNASQTTYGGGDSDAFVGKLRPTGAQLIYMTYLGGSKTDFANAVALDPNNVAVVVGETQSRNFPLASPFRSRLNNDDAQEGPDAFVAKFVSSGTSAPSAPIALDAQVISPTRVDLTWSDTSNNEDGFVIQRKVAGGQYSVVGSAPKDTPVFSDTTVSTNVTYTYQVFAVNDFDSSAGSNEATVTPRPPSAPAKPTGLEATPISSTRIDLHWIDQADNETGFEIERKVGSGNYSPIGAVGPNVTIFKDENVAAGTSYTYHVRAVNGVGNSDYSNEAQATPPVVGVPIAPGNLVATAKPSGTVGLTWVDNSGDETGFKIERKSGSDPFAQVGTVGSGATAFEDQTVLPNTTYTYRVKATNTFGESLPSNEQTVTTPAPSLPTAPANLKAVALTSTRVRLNWTDTSGNETGFRIERKTGTEAFAPIGTAPQNTSTFMDATAKPNTVYAYRVFATNAAGASDPSNESTTKTPAKGGKLKVTPKVLNFGTLKSGKKTLAVHAKNVGPGPLFVTIAKLVAPFTVTPVGDQVIRPGQTLTLNVQYAPTAKGTHRATLVITSDDPAAKTVKVKVTGSRK